MNCNEFIKDFNCLPKETQIYTSLYKFKSKIKVKDKLQQMTDYRVQ